MSTALVTGAGGFIGSHLVEHLVESGWRVRGFVRYTSSGSIGMLSEIEPDVLASVEIIHGDIRDPDSVDRAVDGVDVVFHLAALIGIPYSYDAPDSYVQTNVRGSLHVLRAARRHGTARVIQTSTSEIYGTAQYVPMDERHPIRAQSPYAASKVASDQLALSFHRSFGTPVVVLRPFNTYGPRQSARAVIPTVISQAVFADRIRIGSLEPVRDFVFVRDTCEAFRLAAEASGLEGEDLNCATGSGITVRALIELAQQEIGRRVPVEQEAERVRPMNSEVERLIGSSKKLHALSGWEPRVDLAAGLRRVADWARANPDRFPLVRYAT